MTSVGFRDPGGHVFIPNGRVFRVVNQEAFLVLQSFLSTHAANKLLDGAQLVGTRTVDSAERQEIAAACPPIQKMLTEAPPGTGELLEHERVPFSSYPYEWPAEMLHSAAELTLEIARSINNENWRLKDATPYNILFIGPKPIFVDLLSFELRKPRDMVWLADGQFVRTFLLPLLAHKSFGLSLRDVLSTRRDGLQPEDLYKLSRTFQNLAPPILSLVSIPAWLGRTGSRPQSIPTATDPDQANFVFSALLRRLSRTLKSVAPSEASSRWSDYSERMASIEDEPYYHAKRAFVRETLERHRPRTGLDVGCNTGDFSCLAADAGVSMVAIDSDPVVVGHTWRRAVKHNLDILPLVIDITRPSPDLGWFNTECASFLSRARHRFEIVFLLAVMHHIARDGIPVQEFIRLAHHLTGALAIIEFVHRSDPAFRDMIRGREHVFAPYNLETFEAKCMPYFEIVSRRQVREARWLYLVRKAS